MVSQPPDPEPAAVQPLEPAASVQIPNEDAPEARSDNDASDTDSAIDDESAFSTESLSESILDYRKLHGRPYSSKTQYWAPNDDQQNEGLDLLHNSLLMCLEDKLFLAPIGTNPKRILDIGTGTGLWAIDVADEYPGAEVTGTDISPIQPSWVPPNCKFVIDDFTQEWTWPKQHFDFIHIRSLYGSVTNWEELYQKCYDHLEPGGYLEDAEGDVKLNSDHVTIPPDHIFNRWADVFYAGGEKMGRTFAISCGHTMRDAMIKVGFEDVQERKVKMPMHTWPKDARLREAGWLGQMALDESLEGLGTFVLTQVHKWTLPETMLFVAEMRKESRKRNLCAWLNYTVVYGRKPGKKSEA